MRFRLGLVLGFLAGYVLGAKAGRRRYEQIAAWFRSVSGSEPVQQIATEVREAASQAGEVLEQKATETVSKVSETIEQQSGSGTA